MPAFNSQVRAGGVCDILCVTWRMTHSCVWRHSCLIRMCDMTHDSLVRVRWHIITLASFVCVTWHQKNKKKERKLAPVIIDQIITSGAGLWALISKCDTTQDSLVSAKRLIIIRMCDMTHASFVCVKWLIMPRDSFVRVIWHREQTCAYKSAATF